MSILSSGTSNTTALVYTSDTTGNLVFQTNGTTEAMRITNGGNVGVGTTNPIKPLEVSTTGNFSGDGIRVSSKLAPSTYYNDLKIQNDGTVGGQINTVNYLAVTIDNSEALRFVNGGIKFPATQVSSGDSNTLDDYEEGTFTPTLTTSGTNFSSVSYIAQTGYYTKIGNRVFISILIGWNAFTGSPTGDLLVSGLPFTVSTNGDSTFTTEVYYINFPSISPAPYYVTGQGRGTEAAMFFRVGGNNTDWTAVTANIQSSSGTHYIRTSGFYMV